MRRLLQTLPVISLLGFLTGQTTLSADFQKSYNLGPDSRIKIENISGNIVVSGYEGTTIEVKGIKEGRDKDRVDVEDTSDAGNLSLKARYPQNCSCDASIRFEVRVPRSLPLKLGRLSTASGDIKVDGATGEVEVHSASGNLRIQDVNGGVHANTASGDVTIKQIRGSVSAESASGDIAVEIATLEGNDHHMKVTTASGDVTVKLQANPDVEVEMSTVSGAVQTDFPIQINTPEFGPGQSARGRLGNGTYTLHMTTVSGDVHLGRL